MYRVNVKQFILSQFCGTSADAELVAELVAEKGEAEYGSHHNVTNTVAFATTRTRDKRVTFIEPERRLGFGLGVRSALRMVDTPFVWIQQHDWGLVADIPVENILKVMQASEADAEAPVKYVCFSAIRMLSYATSADVDHFTTLKDLTATLKRDFSPPNESEQKVPLTPMFFWHDKPHIASTEHYLGKVFPSRLAMLRGDFIEDKIGQRARTQMKEGLWLKWATWLYYPDEGRQLCLRHLQGRIWRGVDAHTRQIAAYREQNTLRLQKLESLRADVTDSTGIAVDDDVLDGLFEHYHTSQ
jgi:hypothetical protein